ncbi:hypothetical protein PFISCL1PPCAC_13468, partial [Pristionchus fissidentatus]
PVDRGYEPGFCSTPSDVKGPPTKASTLQLTSENNNKNFSAILHDGTHMVLENQKTAFVDWDASLGSWFFSMTAGLSYYFKCGTCVYP